MTASGNRRLRRRGNLLGEGVARPSGYDDAEDEISKKIQIQEEQRLFYWVQVKTEEEEHPADGLVVRLTDDPGKHLASIEIQTYAATQRAGEDGWVEDSVNLSRFASKAVRLSFLAKTNKERPTTFYVDGVALR